MNKVLITGADGFIGKHLTDYMIQKNVDVYAIVYPGNNIYTERLESNLHVIEWDLLNKDIDTSVFPSDISVMYLFAWIGVRPELREDIDVQIKNITISINSIKLANDIGIKRIIFPGSTNEYLYYGKPLNANAIPSPNNAYGAVKISLRYICFDYAIKHEMEFIYTIIAGIYAPDRRDNNVIYYTINKLLNGEKPILTSLEQLWDYVHIDDVVFALYEVGERGKNQKVYAIGHGDNWALSNYIRIIHEEIDKKLPLGIGEIKNNSDILPSSCIDLTDIIADTQFRPQVDFKTGIKCVIEQIRKDDL